MTQQHPITPPPDLLHNWCQPEQWNLVQQCADVLGSADCSAILELRSRVETLEAAAQKHIVETSANILALASRVEALEAAKRPAPKVYEINKPLQLTPEQAQQITDLLTPNSSKPVTRSLVQRVAFAISGVEYGFNWDEVANWSFEARAAIREVAAWLIDRKSQDDWLAPFDEVVKLIQMEIEQ